LCFLMVELQSRLDLDIWVWAKHWTKNGGQEGRVEMGREFSVKLFLLLVVGKKSFYP